MAAATRLLKEWSGCEAVGVRLHQGEDFPYCETMGFPAAFVQLENSLCARDQAGKLRRDSQGNPVLECMCGNVIRGRINPALPFFTPGGSFWTNSTTELLAATSDRDRQARTRNRCHGEGFESVALVPLTSGNQALGLLQFNDRHRGKFTPAMIQLLERLADNLASGIARRQAEEALRESEERYRLAQQAAQIGSFAWNIQTGENIWTPELEAIYGLPPGGFARTQPSWENLVHPDDRAQAVRLVERAFETGEPTEGELARIRPDGSVHWLAGRWQTFKDESGQPLRMTGVNIDTTARKQAEEALRESEERYRSLFENNHAVMLLVDPEAGVVVDANPAACEYYGFPRAGLVGRARHRASIRSPRSRITVQEMQQARDEKTAAL